VESLPAAGWDGRVRELSRKEPRIYLLDDFISGEELVLARLSDRLERAAYLPAAFAEALTLERSAAAPASGEGASVGPRAALQEKRYAWILLFLSDGEAGGELIFPLHAHCGHPLGNCCAEVTAEGLAPGGTLRILARMGRAVLFYPDATPAASASVLCPPHEGASAWTLRRSFVAKPSKGWSPGKRGGIIGGGDKAVVL